MNLVVLRRPRKMKMKDSSALVLDSKQRATRTANGVVAQSLAGCEAQATMAEVFTMILVDQCTKCLQSAAAYWIFWDAS